jgi:hypothetical protein
MNQLKQFVSNFNISTHTLVGVYATVTAFLAADQRARDAVFGFLNTHPVYSMLFSFAAFAYAKYSGSHSTQGIIQQITNTSPEKVAKAEAAIISQQESQPDPKV